MEHIGRKCLLFVVIATFMSSPFLAQQAPGLSADKAAIAAQDARFAQWRIHAPEGSGPYPAERIEDPTLSTHTLYEPRDLKGVATALPIISFGNGGCRNTSIEFTAFLSELASHGYLVVAAGRNDVEFSAGMMPGTTANGQPLQVTDAQQLVRGVDWAIAENARAGSRLFGKLDTKAIAYMGQSCGGLQALTASADPRTTTTVVLNSAYIDNLPPGIPKNALPERLPYTAFHAPMAFFIGGKTDIAYGNAKKAFADITTFPVFIANLGVGHTGAYPAPDRRWTDAVLAWLQWQLRGDKEAAKQFLGKDCGLCTDTAWSEVDSKNLH